MSVFAVVCAGEAADRPNILLAISDDQSFPHASAYGCEFVKTPAFDRVAETGILFTNAYGASPGCSPCRAALLTGRHIWQIENAGTHASSFPAKYRTFPEVLSENGYFAGYTGKGWGPGNFQVDGREQNPAGRSFGKVKAVPPHKGMSNNDYAANFADFLDQRPEGQPFCFWFGASEPHRSFEKGAGLAEGKKLENVSVPDFLPDAEEVRSDLLDYAVEIEHFDAHLGRMLDHLAEMGELDNTLVIVTSDNGMAFPRAKANCFEYGIHMPLAICWGDQIEGGKTHYGLIGFIDLTAMIYQATGVDPQLEYPLASSIREPGEVAFHLPENEAVFSGRERHSSSRFQNLAYPQRAMRMDDYLAIWNCRPERWPAGAPQKLDKNGELGPEHGGYHDIDACPTLSFLIEHADDEDLGKYLHFATDRREEFELYNVVEDPDCLKNLVGQAGIEETEERMFIGLQEYLVKTEDPRILNGGDIFETYRRYSALRSFPAPEHVQGYEQMMKEEGWHSLFNGENLDGWKASQPADSFEVVNGMIKAQATADQSHLFYTGDVHGADFTDFELLAEVMTTPGSNAGIYFHTSSQETGFPDDGHEVQVNNTHKNKNKTGSLFSVKDVTESLVPDNQIFELYVLVRGKKVQIRVNDETVVEYEEPADYEHKQYKGRNIDHGTFALQAHDPESTVYFREIWVRPLDQ
ncbi:MAG: sulfatase-like hydrolase/transferase [Planctomycetaceae bacterium]|nr:sulfatase-like hydrolase/transferase [Planctomycetaceae bacterium]